MKCRTEVFSKKSVPQFFIIGEVILIDNSKFKTRKHNFNLKLLKKTFFPKNIKVWGNFNMML